MLSLLTINGQAKTEVLCVFVVISVYGEICSFSKNKKVSSKKNTCKIIDNKPSDIFVILISHHPHTSLNILSICPTYTVILLVFSSVVFSKPWLDLCYSNPASALCSSRLSIVFPPESLQWMDLFFCKNYHTITSVLLLNALGSERNGFPHCS